MPTAIVRLGWVGVNAGLAVRPVVCSLRASERPPLPSVRVDSVGDQIAGQIQQR
jgi:hypothetical protein